MYKSGVLEPQIPDHLNYFEISALMTIFGKFLKE